MILADTSVWMDYLRGEASWQAARLDALLGEEELLLGDIILLEILQGFTTEAEARRVEALLEPVDTIEIGGRALAVEAARLYRALRRKGITVRSTIDTLIAARCLADGLTLLHGDRDFVPFEREFGRAVVRQPTH
jgi:predicted nucleic acid-binding protein